MRNRFPCVCCSGVGGRLIWNQLSGDQLISTQSIPPQLISGVLFPQIAPLSHLLLPKLSTLVDCCLGLEAQHLQAFCMLLATHCHHIVVVPLLLSNCRCPIAILKMPLLLLLILLPQQRQRHCHKLPSLSMSLRQRCFVIFVIVVLFGSQF